MAPQTLNLPLQNSQEMNANQGQINGQDSQARPRIAANLENKNEPNLELFKSMSGEKV